MNSSRLSLKYLWYTSMGHKNIFQNKAKTLGSLNFIFSNLWKKDSLLKLPIGLTLFQLSFSQYKMMSEKSKEDSLLSIKFRRDSDSEVESEDEVSEFGKKEIDSDTEDKEFHQDHDSGYLFSSDSEGETSASERSYDSETEN